jgi:hypothetical protein
MLTFLNSIILAGLAAIALPLLIHLLTRQRLKKIEFSSISFLKLLQAQKMRRVRLREIILLILRTLIVLFLILAFARPALKGSFATGVKAHANTTVAILLDNSLSMGRETPRGSVFQMAQDRAIEVAGLLKEGDEAYLILFSDMPALVTPEPTHNFHRLARQIQDAQLSHGTTDVRTALLAAYELLAESVNLNKEIYLLTDLQRSGWSSLERDSLAVGAGARLYILSIFSDGGWNNLTVDAVDYSDQLPEAGKPLRFATAVSNHSAQQSEQSVVELFVNRVRRAQHGVQLAPGETQGVTFTTVLADPGIHSGYAEVTDNQLPADNRRFFTLNVPRRIRVLIVGDDPRAAFFLQTALRPDEQVHGVMVPEFIPTEGLRTRGLDEFDALVFADLPSLDGDQLAKVDRFVRQGGGLLILLGNDIDHYFYNDHLLKRLCPVSIQEALGSPTQRESYLTIEQVDWDHPVFQVFRSEEREKFPSPKFYMAYDVAPDEKVSVLASFNNGSPAMAESRSGRGRVLFLATAVDPTWTDLPVRGAFIPLVHRSVHYLATAQPSDGEDLLVGSDLSWDMTEIPEGQEVTCLTPDGERVSLRPSGQRGYTVAAYEDAEQPGIYQFFLGDQLLTAFAVNVDLSESDLDPIGADQARQLLGEEMVFSIAPDTDLETAILQSRHGRELWKAVLWTVLALMAVEMVLGKSGAAKQQETITRDEHRRS